MEGTTMKIKRVFTKLTSLLLAVMMLTGLFAAMPLTFAADTPLGPNDAGACDISYPGGKNSGVSLNQAFATAKTYGGYTVEITMLNDVTIPGDLRFQDEESIMLYLRDNMLIIEGGLIIDGHVPFELYGSGSCEIGSLSKSNMSWTSGLYAYGTDTKVTVNGDVNLINCVNSVGVYASGWGAEVTVKGSVNCAGNGNTGVQADFYSAVEIQGDVNVTGEGVLGAITQNNGNITVDGEIKVPAGERFIYVGSAEKTPEQYEEVSSKPGYLEYLGSNNSYVWVKEPTAAHTHNYTPAVTAPTCTEQGYTTYTCDCGDSYVDDYVPAAGHIGRKAHDFCDEDSVCEVCGENLDDATSCTPVKEHGYCDEDAICTVCGQSFGGATAHSWDGGTITAPTCTEGGFTTYACTVCGAEKTEDLTAALGHTDADGDGYCDVCGAKISADGPFDAFYRYIALIQRSFAVIMRLINMILSIQAIL